MRAGSVVVVVVSVVALLASPDVILLGELCVAGTDSFLQEAVTVWGAGITLVPLLAISGALLVYVYPRPSALALVLTGLIGFFLLSLYHNDPAVQRTMYWLTGSVPALRQAYLQYVAACAIILFTGAAWLLWPGHKEPGEVLSVDNAA